MNPRSNLRIVFRAVCLLALVASLPACQKQKMSSVQRSPAPTRPPGTWVPPGPGPVRPPIVVHPPGGTMPPGPIYPPPGATPQPPVYPPPTVVVPPRVTPPQVIPPGSTPPPGVTPSPTPGPSGPPVVVVLPPTSPSPTPPGTYNPPTPPTYNPPVANPPSYQDPGGSVVIVPPPGTTPPNYPPTTPPNYPPNYPPVVSSPPTGGGGIPVITPGGSGQPGPIRVTPAGSGGAGVVVKTPVGQHPITPISGGPVRVQTPVREGLFRTCNRETCQPQEVIFVPGQPPRKEEFTCPPAQVPVRPITSRLDILFVVDTSASMKQERADIARQMGSFIRELSPDVDYRIGVVLGHGPRTKAKNGDGREIAPGELFYTKGTEAVIKMDELKKRAGAIEIGLAQNRNRQRHESAQKDGSPVNGQAYIIEQVVKDLTEKMLAVPNDSSEAQGEALLMNLKTAVTQKLPMLKQAGIWEDGAAKVVIFIADENDICFDYSKPNVNGKMYTHHAADEDEYRRTEKIALGRSDVCGGINAESVKASVLASSPGMPVMFTGIHYLKNERIPKRGDKFAGDNEMAHGLLDIIALGNGQAADLGSGNFGGMLAKFGDFSNFGMKYPFDFELEGVRNVTDIDPETVIVELTDPDGTKHTLNAANVNLDIHPVEMDRARIVIKYETLQRVYADGKVKPGTKVHVRYARKSSQAKAAVQPAAANQPVGQGTVLRDETRTPVPVQLSPQQQPRSPEPAAPASNSREIEDYNRAGG